MYSYRDNAALNCVSTSRKEAKQRRKLRLIKALYDYTARTDTDISFRKGDRMDVLEDTNSDWWMVRHSDKNVQGYVPIQYVADESSLECEDWFFPQTSRAEAHHLLLASENTPVGSFLVRQVKEGKENHEYTLSVKGCSRRKGYHVKHYKIYHDEDHGFYIVPTQMFISLPSLILAYTNPDSGLSLHLIQPCPKPAPHMYDLAPTTHDNWEIPRSEVKLIRKLGIGNFGEVWYGKWKDNTEVGSWDPTCLYNNNTNTTISTQRQDDPTIRPVSIITMKCGTGKKGMIMSQLNAVSAVAVKTLKEGTMTTTQDFLQEAAIMKKLRHKRLVALYAICSLQEPVYIVQEYMSKGSLLDFLRKGDGRNFSFEQLIYIAAQIASGMEYVESKLLIHRDLAARNVLMSSDNSAKICDFGLARVIENEEYCIKKGTRFPVKWTAPEALLYGKFSIKSDVWSYGILLMELFTKGKVPYPGMSTREVATEVPKGYRMPKPRDIPMTDEVYSILMKCWNREPENRPTFDFLFHFFEGFNVTTENMYKQPENKNDEDNKKRCCRCCIFCCCKQ